MLCRALEQCLGATGTLGNSRKIASLATACLHRKQPRMQTLPTPLGRLLGRFPFAGLDEKPPSKLPSRLGKQCRDSGCQEKVCCCEMANKVTSDSEVGNQSSNSLISTVTLDRSSRERAGTGLWAKLEGLRLAGKLNYSPWQFHCGCEISILVVVL